MNKEDYFKYYIQGSEHYLIPKDVFNELFNEMNNWKEDTQKYKEVIDKAIEYIKERFYFNEETGEYSLLHTFDKCNVKELLDILNDVSK